MPSTPSQAPHSVLLLVPAYNEEERIGPMLREYTTHFRAHYAGPFRLVVVLNGCRDGTLGVVQQAAREFPEISWLDFPGRIGKGGALIEGLKLAPEADLIGYVDADGATGPAAFLSLVSRADEADCVIGSRWLPGSVLHMSQTWVRRRFSRVFHALVEALFWMNLADTQCPAKVIHRTAVMAVHDALQIADLAFDVNLLYALKHRGFQVLEVPIEWTDKMGSTVTRNLLRSSLVMFLSVVRLRLVYSPFRWLLQPLRPLETWLYARLKAPPPLSTDRQTTR
ncbi:MAG: glycosyltransferase [Verrucomicrobia bacterium]|nr:glycosyltransferase [Verrucomicrobiota bacterium]